MAVEKIVMPQLGESVTEGTISTWLVKVGDTVNKYDPIAEVMTDKVNAEVPSSFSGEIKELVAEEGETIAIGELICYIEVEESSYTIKESEKNSSDNKRVKIKREENKTEKQTNKKRYSPAVLRLSQEHGINLEKVEGTGIGGRITRKDLQKLIDAGDIPKDRDKEEKGVEETPLQSAEQVSQIKTASKKTVSVPVDKGDIEIPISGVRKAIASNMVRSKHEAPHAWTMLEVDVTNLVNYRNKIKEEFKNKEGYNLTFFPFFIKAVVEGLKEFPQVNSMWAGDKIIQKKDINISIAVATDDALYVPVIKNADEKSIKGIAKEVNELAVKVRTGKLKTEDMTGGTFTVNNTGSFGSVQSMGIINYPQAAILQVESIVKRPVVMNNGMIAVRDIVNLCLSLDHRVLDGLVCGRFLAKVKEKLENISEETTSIY
ncbi:2-oxo acid dehydrogenase subunit E2 [Bacillus taeanensis]|uniref:Dihydrolipoamide acetyltransferase component of pyruvate dehydrogenase complex n=2 Tax=Bacillus taeanensis TaxID=273032 RepID=A0A366XXK2_9BACI|nr:dihydrolipoamide acetyltransferase family protein [Bacillus taeanensis]RBW70627.1 2-oxo acid dehydrogenase subunit E2 [Bacillus taeanensis]